MENYKLITDILWYSVPAFLVMLGMFLMIRQSLASHGMTLRKLIEKDLQIKVLEEHALRRKESLPLKLQAYERMILFLERIGPNSLLIRVNRGGMTAGQLQSELLATIRAEFEHNLSQQIYITNRAWIEVSHSKEETIKIINNAFNRVGQHATGIQMSAAIFEQVLEMETIPTQEAIDFIKAEAKKLMD